MKWLNLWNNFGLYSTREFAHGHTNTGVLILRPHTSSMHSIDHWCAVVLTILMDDYDTLFVCLTLYNNKIRFTIRGAHGYAMCACVPCPYPLKYSCIGNRVACWPLTSTCIRSSKWIVYVRRCPCLRTMINCTFYDFSIYSDLKKYGQPSSGKEDKHLTILTNFHLQRTFGCVHLWYVSSDLITFSTYIHDHAPMQRGHTHTPASLAWWSPNDAIIICMET